MLVLGAGGGIGLAAVDVALALGARVVAAASSDGEAGRGARAWAPHATVDYESEDLKTRVRELTDGGVDVVVDPVGGRHSEPALRATKTFGRFCVIGFASGPIASVPLNQVLLNNRTVVGVDWGAWAMRDPEDHRAMLDELIEMVQSGRLHPVEPAERPFDEAAAGHGAPCSTGRSRARSSSFPEPPRPARADSERRGLPAGSDRADGSARVADVLLVDAFVPRVGDLPRSVDLRVAVVVQRRAVDLEVVGGDDDAVLEVPTSGGGVVVAQRRSRDGARCAW